MAGNIVEIELYRFYANDQLQYLSKYKLYFINNNVNKIELYKDDGSYYNTEYFEYDSKKNIYKNILGFDKLFFTQSYTNSFNRYFRFKDISNSNNVTNSSETSKCKFIYDTEGYPIEQLEFYSDIATLSRNKFYYY